MREGYSFRGKRLFVAIEIPGYLREILAAVQSPLKGFHWVEPERFHLTLKFIGDVPGQHQGAIEDALETVDVGTFMLPVEGLGRFPDRGKPHAVWAGLGTAHPRLFQLHKRIDDALFGIGIEPEKRCYHPHLTLARVNQAAPETVRQFLKRGAGFGAPPFFVERFHLYRSEQIDGRCVHTIEHTWDLRAENRMAS